MKFIRLLVVILIFSSLAHAAPEAILTDVKGAVQVVQSGKCTAGKNGATLNVGDTVRVGAGGAATDYYANRPPQSLKANQQIQVAAPGATTKPSVWSNIYNGVAAGFARRGEKVGATVRGDENNFATKSVIPLSPVNSHVLQRPVLAWVLRDATGDFEVTVRDTNDNVVWQGQTVKSSLAIAPQVVLAAGTKYHWCVTPRSRDAAGKVQLDDEKSSIDSWFIIAPETEVAPVRQEQAEIAAALKDESESTRRLAQATALAERGFYDDAIALLTKRTLENAIAQSATDANLRAGLETFKTLLAALDEATRWQLRRFYADTQQIELANFIAPDVSVQEAVAGGQTTANNQTPN